MMELTEPLPCPFCGGTDIELTLHDHNDYESNWYWVVGCVRCDAGLNPEFSTELEAIEAWNTRTTTTTNQKDTDRQIREVLDKIDKKMFSLVGGYDSKADMISSTDLSGFLDTLKPKRAGYE